MTRHVSYKEFQRNPAKYMDKVRGPDKALHIKREEGSVVMMSEEEFRGWKETLYLLRSAANAKVLLTAIAEADAGKLQAHELIEE